MAPDTEVTDGGPEDRDRTSAYEAWGVVVQTSNVRAAHVANGIIQLLRLAPQGAPEEAVSAVLDFDDAGGE